MLKSLGHFICKSSSRTLGRKFSTTQNTSSIFCWDTPEVEVDLEDDLREEYYVIGESFEPSISSFSKAMKPKNISKNRYQDYIEGHPFNEYLVDLGLPRKENYINASRMFLNGITYYATQWPLASTQSQFWEMIYHNQCETIVCLRDPYENDDVLGHPIYWPVEIDSEKETTRGIKIVNECVDDDENHSFSSIDFTLSRRAEQPEESLDVKLLVYSHWPDHGVPEEFETLHDLIQEVNSIQDSDIFSKPIVVHCSAGCGRTGVFILLHNLLSSDSDQGIRETLMEMRTMRLCLIENYNQYQFCYDFLEVYS